MVFDFEFFLLNMRLFLWFVGSWFSVKHGELKLGCLVLSLSEGMGIKLTPCFCGR